MGKPEGRIENHLRDRCKKRGWLCWKWVSPGTSGVPDRIVIAPGRVVFVELKSPVGRLSSLQKVRIAELRALGAEVHVINSQAGVDTLVEELANRTPVL